MNSLILKSMNKIVKRVFCLALVSSISLGAFAQESRGDRRPDNRKGQEEMMQQKKNWQEKFRAEKVAYLTRELDLTSAEAEVFWPVYNQIEKERFEAMKQRMDAYKALKAALKDGKDAKEIEQLTEAYVLANDCQKFDLDAVARLNKVLPVEKVAKLVLAEEKFRSQQFHRLKGGDDIRRGEGNPRPDRKADKTADRKADKKAVKKTDK